MAFTCPDCLWTSHNPTDEQEGYCGHCSTWPVGGNLNSTSFQADAIRALRGQTPARSLLAVVVHQAGAGGGVPVPQIFEALGPLFTAEKITTEQRDVLRLMFTALRMIEEGRAALTDLEVADQ